jgi:hypothetical protein
MLKALAIAALLTAPSTTNAPPPCLTRGEIQDMTFAVLPLALDATAEACRATLPADAFLLTGGRALSERLKQGSEAHWAGAIVGFLKIAGSKDVPAGLQAETLHALGRDLLNSELRKTLKPADCGFANDLAETLAPLSPDGIARVVVAGFLIARHEQKKADKSFPALCPSPAA